MAAILPLPTVSILFCLSNAVMFVAFFVGFITVLCIGNYFRAKCAKERQRQCRMTKLAACGNSSSSNQVGFAGGSPLSNFASGSANGSFSEPPINDGSSVGPHSQIGKYKALLHVTANQGVWA